MQETLTTKQQLVYEYLLSESKKRGYPPSIKEICTALGLKSTATVHNHLTTLEKKGYIRKYPTKNRVFEIIDAEERPCSKAVSTSPKTSGVFVYHAPNSKLRNLGILKGDVVHCKCQPNAEPGQLVAIWENDAITLKTYSHVDFINNEILGVAVELRRKY